jgi:hypothetical protein
LGRAHGLFRAQRFEEERATGDADVECADVQDGVIEGAPPTNPVSADQLRWAAEVRL